MARREGEHAKKKRSDRKGASNVTLRLAHLAFCAIWLATALAFGRLAIDSYAATKTELATIYPHFPSSVSMNVLGVDLPRLMVLMANANNANAIALQESIRKSARLTLWLNSLSTLMALIGLTAQIGVYLHEARGPPQ